MRIELYHQILLHVPLNLFWRLIGLNRNLNKLLRSEHFWLEKCQTEFHLLHDRIGSYRRYYFLRSNNIVGTLYTTEGNIVATAVRYYHRVFLNEGDIFASLYLTRSTLKLVDPERDDKLISSMEEVDAIFDVAAYVYIITRQREKRVLLVEEDGRFIEETLDDHFGLFDLSDVIRLTYCNMYWALLSNGDLYYFKRKSKQGRMKYAEGVIDVTRLTVDIIAVIHRSGVCELVSTAPEIKSVRSLQTYVRWKISDATCVGFRMDGLCDRYTEYDLDFEFRQQRPIFPYQLNELSFTVPIRDFFYEHKNKQYHNVEIFVTIDGVGHLNIKTKLTKYLPTIDYVGITNLGDGERLVAVSKN